MRFLLRAMKSLKHFQQGSISSISAIRLDSLEDHSSYWMETRFMWVKMYVDRAALRLLQFSVQEIGMAETRVDDSRDTET